MIRGLVLASDHIDISIQPPTTSGRPSSRGILLWIVLVVLSITQAAMATPTVTIEGGVDTAGRMYTWIVLHDHTSPIVSLQFPQDRGNGLTAPPGWKGELQRADDNLHQSGFARFTCVDESRAIRANQPATFKLNLVWRGASRGVGDVIVRFADGTQTTALASIPIKEPASDRNVSLIGLGSFFAIFLIVQAIRKRRRRLA